MFALERKQEIMTILKKENSMTVRKLAATLFVSEASIRRDLTVMEKEGLVKRVHGGVMLLPGTGEVPLLVREREEEAAKRRICEEASKLIRDGNVIFLDASSTAQFLVRHLERFDDITVITNGLKIAEELIERHIPVYCTGGYVLEKASAMAGKPAEEMLRQFNADICFISCKGLSQSGILSDTSLPETQLRQVMLEQAKQSVLLLTGNKLGKTYIHTLCRSTDVDYIISDAELPDSIRLRNSESR